MAMYVDSFQPLLKLISNEIDCKYNTVLKGLALIGLLYVSGKAFQFTRKSLSSIKTYVVSSCWKKSLKDLGDWAIILICDDLGAEFANLLAEDGINLILIDYNPRVHIVGNDLERKFKIKCEVITFSPENVKFAVDNLEDHSANKNFCALINNTDVMHLDTCFLSEALKEIIGVNIEAFSMVTNAVLPRMLARNMGTIISVSSWSTKFPKLISSYYAPTKLYMDCYMDRLRYKYRHTNVTFTCLTPLNILTKDKFPLFWPHTCPLFNPGPGRYVRRALLTAGQSGQHFGYCYHFFQSCFLRILPHCSWIQSFFIA